MIHFKRLTTIYNFDTNILSIGTTRYPNNISFFMVHQYLIFNFFSNLTEKGMTPIFILKHFKHKNKIILCTHYTVSTEKRVSIIFSLSLSLFLLISFTEARPYIAQAQGRSTGRQRKLRFRKKYKRFLLPLLLAYKLKFFTLIPVLIGGLCLLVGATGTAGFFFALFAATISLKGSAQ